MHYHRRVRGRQSARFLISLSDLVHLGLAASSQPLSKSASIFEAKLLRVSRLEAGR